MKNWKQYLNNPNILLAILLLVWWVANLLQSAFMELHFDEAYYWVYSKHLAWGYFDHPPMTAFLIRLGSFFNDHELGVRLFMTVLQPVYLYLFWTLLRTPLSTRKDAILYFLICAAIPMLEAYGFIATPDAPLMFFTALFLVAYKYFLKEDSMLAALALGLSIAGLAYSKYHGALVVLFIMLPNILKLLRNPRFYVAILITIVALIPHFVWLYQNDFQTLRYHLMERNKVFKPNYVSEYLLNLVACYHPYIFLVSLYAMIKRKPKDVFEKGIYLMTVGFYIFFLISTFRGYVQPQWTLPTVFGIVYVVYKYAEDKMKFSKILRVVSLVSVLLFIPVRIFFMVANPENSRLFLFNNEANNKYIARVAEGKPVLFTTPYIGLSSYLFYARQPAATHLDIYRRSSQYMYWNYDDELKGKTVLVESSGPNVVKLNGKREFRYYIYEDYMPVRKVVIKSDIPQNMKSGERVNLKLQMTNPYNYDIPFGPASRTELRIVFRNQKKDFHDIILPVSEVKELKAGDSLSLETNFIVPEVVGEYSAVICIQRVPLPYVANSKEIKVVIQ